MMAMRIKTIEVFFDFCVLFSVIIFALDGFIDSNKQVVLNDITTILLFIELLMKIISISLSNY